MGLASRNVNIALVGKTRPTSRAEKCEMKYRGILEAARKVFADKGFYNAKVIDIAHEANVASGTIYLYFKNKDDIIIKLFEEAFRDMASEIRVDIRGERDVRAKLRKFCLSYLTILKSDPYLAELIHVEMNAASKFVCQYRAENYQELINILVDIINEGRRNGTFRERIMPELTARMLMAGLNEVSMQMLTADDKSEVSDFVSAVLFNGLGLFEEEQYVLLQASY